MSSISNDCAYFTVEFEGFHLYTVKGALEVFEPSKRYCGPSKLGQ